MAEIGNEFPIQNPGVNIPGLANARLRNQDEEEQNRVEENRREQNRVDEERAAQDAQEAQNIPDAQTTPNPQNLPTDRVTVAGPADARTNPGLAEQRVLRANGELVIVPSQNLQEIPEPEETQGFDLGQPVGDLNQPPADFQARAAEDLTALPDQPAEPNPNTLNDQIREAAANAIPTLDQVLQQQPAGRPEPVERQPNPPDRTVQNPVEQVANNRGPEPAPQTPDNRILETPPREVRNLTQDRAGVSTTSTGRPNADDVNIRETVRNNVEEQRLRQNQENEQREPERAQTQRGQNVDRLI